ncbi:hypothetical protein [Streptomyces sp. NPDC057428]|uniref:hypothetical protein n=1 Tax=Streptomyces sp. NPDC057428 TaxID=3346129 RepID=UPI00369BC737
MRLVTHICRCVFVAPAAHLDSRLFTHISDRRALDEKGRLNGQDRPRHPHLGGAGYVAFASPPLFSYRRLPGMSPYARARPAERKAADRLHSRASFGLPAYDTSAGPRCVCATPQERFGYS